MATLTGDWVRIWDVTSAKEARRFRLPNASEARIDEMNMIGAQVVFSPDGKMIAASNPRDGTIFLLDAATGKELGRAKAPRTSSRSSRSPPTAGSSRPSSPSAPPVEGRRR